MSISPAACGEIRPDDCAIVRTRLISKHLSSEIHPRPSELADDKKKTPCFCVLEQGVFAYSAKDNLFKVAVVVRMSFIKYAHEFRHYHTPVSPSVEVFHIVNFDKPSKILEVVPNVLLRLV